MLFGGEVVLPVGGGVGQLERLHEFGAAAFLVANCMDETFHLVAYMVGRHGFLKSFQDGYEHKFDKGDGLGVIKTAG